MVEVHINKKQLNRTMRIVEYMEIKFSEDRKQTNKKQH